MRALYKYTLFIIIKCLFVLKDLISTLEMCESRIEELHIKHAFIVLSKATSPKHTRATPTSPRHAPAVIRQGKGQEVTDPELSEVAVDLEQLHQIADEHREKLQVALVQQVHWNKCICFL